MAEKSYDFRIRMDAVHKSGRRDKSLKLGKNEVCLKEGLSLIHISEPTRPY